MNTRLISTTGLLIALVLFVTANIIANASLTSWRIDVTEDQLYTLSQGTHNIVANIDEPVKLRFYFSAKAFSGIPQLISYGGRVRDLLEEYEAGSDGKLELIIIDPEPFSEAEDQAVGFGIQQVPIGNTGEAGYFGLVGTNSTDDEMAIPFFQLGKEDALEYELTKLVYNLANPTKRVVGVISSLGVFGSPMNPMQRQPPQEPWTLISLLREIFDLRDLGANASAINEEIDTLLVIHPKSLSDESLYAIDQFVLRGGKAMVFVDPVAEEDQTASDPTMPMLPPERSSDLAPLFAKWGLKLLDGKVAGDIEAAIRVSFPSGRGPQEVEYLPWLQLTKKNLNAADFVTNELETVNLGAAGILEPIETTGMEFQPLIKTGLQSIQLAKEQIQFANDPNALLAAFEASNTELVLAARITGIAETAFPAGRPSGGEGQATPTPDPNFIKASASPINVIVVADTDLLADRFWVQVQNFLGMRMPTPFSDNANFVINTIENLGGNDDLISLRSRGGSVRPFDRVADLRRTAEAQFRDKEEELQAKLENTEAKLRELQQQREGTSTTMLSVEQQRAVEAFRSEQVEIRKALRDVQHELKKDIESLGTKLKFANIGLVPLLIGLFAIVTGFARSNRQKVT